MCLDGAVVAYWSLMQVVACSSPLTVIQWKHLGKTPMPSYLSVKNISADGSINKAKLIYFLLNLFCSFL